MYVGVVWCVSICIVALGLLVYLMLAFPLIDIVFVILLLCLMFSV